MKEYLQGLKRVIKRIVEANVSGEHYWFVKKPKNVSAQSNKAENHDLVWVTETQMEETSPGEQRVRVG